MGRRRDRIGRGAAGALVLLVWWCTGCGTPVGIRIADPREVQRYLTRSALSEDVPSDYSSIELRRYALLEEYDDDPEAALAKLRDFALAQGLPNDELFALAELWFLRANETGLQAHYTATALYAYAFLFPEDGRPPLAPLDPRERTAADLYNRALTLAFRRTKAGTLALDGPALLELPFGRLAFDVPADLLQRDEIELFDLQPVAELEIRGLRNRYRRAGIGAPLAGKSRPLPGTLQPLPVGKNVRVPLTALVRIDTPIAGLRSGELRGRIDLFETLERDDVAIDGRTVPLEAETTAALAAGLEESRFWQAELQMFLGNALGMRTATALGAMRPYKHGRIPVVFVHGTASSPGRWADMMNDLIADPRIRTRFEFWAFRYDSGQPIAYSGWQLRDALAKTVAIADPTGDDPCVRDMVVLGHSQGGLLTKLTAIDSGNGFWAPMSDRPFDQVKLPAKDRELLQAVLFVKPLPFVRRVVFLATPQRGSYLAGPQIVRRLAQRMVRLPSDVVKVGADLARPGVLSAAGVDFEGMPTSIDNMSPGNRFIKALAPIPVSPNVVAHSIIAKDGDGPLQDSGDGVVKYASAHVDGVESELVVPSPHSGMQAAPQTIEEMRRILLEHSAKSACPMPLPENAESAR